MKKLIVSVLVLVGFSAHVLAQTITVNNFNGTGDWSATSFGLFFNKDGTPYNGATLNITVSEWLPDGSTIPIVTLSRGSALLRALDGMFFDPGFVSYIVPGVAPGGTAQLQVQAWRGSAATYDQAYPEDKFYPSTGTLSFSNPTGASNLYQSLDGMPAMRLVCLTYPYIIQHPTNQVVYRGGTASFTAGAINAAFRYWLFNGTVIPGSIQYYSGTSTLVITNVQPTNAGTYSLLVIGNEGASCGIPISSNATLTVVNNTLGLALGAHPSLTIEGIVGQTFGIQATTNLSLPNSWLHLTNVTLTAPLQEWVDTSVDSPPGGVPQRFYRVIPVP